MSENEVIVDGQSRRVELVSTTELTELIAPYVGIEKYASHTPRIVMKDEYHTLTPREQVLVSLFANEIVYRELEKESWFISVQELFNRYGLNPNSHYPYIRELEQDEIVERRNPNKYAVKTEWLEEAVEELC